MQKMQRILLREYLDDAIPSKDAFHKLIRRCVRQVQWKINSVLKDQKSWRQNHQEIPRKVLLSSPTFVGGTAERALHFCAYHGKTDREHRIALPCLFTPQLEIVKSAVLRQHTICNSGQRVSSETPTLTVESAEETVFDHRFPSRNSLGNRRRLMDITVDTFFIKPYF
ncbi:hypothetical protein TNCV_2395091 [Trichonephila clavipes]|nr:hypothetical protein TNCV_2395091 [Trichonephila clavipes]